MWSYYGRKAKIARHYPVPLYPTIVEEFCGTAAYSLLYWDRDVYLYDINYTVIAIWHYLQRASEKDILSLPVPPPHYLLDNYTQLCDEERWLIGFCLNNGSAMPKKQSTGFGNFNSWPRDQQRIARDLYKVRHWRIFQADYREVQDIPATHFIDPPYQHGSRYYRHGGIDYPTLRSWIDTRHGQIIVCENSKADWIAPLTPVHALDGQRHRTLECIWYRND